MELHGDRLIPAPVATTWAALNDPETLKGCIAGCESLERTGDDAYTAVVALKIGPVSARFKGNLKMTDVSPPNGYTINFDGQGGVAGFGRGSANVRLVPEGDAATRLTYDARAQVGGKMAQIGSRLVDATAGKLTDDFFRCFEERLRPAHSEPDEAAPLTSGVAAADSGGTKWLGWAIVALVAAALIAWLLLR